MTKKYYHAYEDRYKKVHEEKGKPWAGERPSTLLKDLLLKYGANEKSSILEIGCGEGQNALYLMSEGFSVDASDISPEAISWCKNWAKERGLDGDRFFVMDACDNDFEGEYDFIYSVAVLHMLVEDEDRHKFLSFINRHLKKEGRAFVIVMGDGTMSYRSGTKEAFELADRPFEDGIIQVATTSCRKVTWEEYLAELDRAGLKVLDHYVDRTISGFDVSMVAELARGE